MSNKKRTNNILIFPARKDKLAKLESFALLDKVAEMGIDHRDLVDPQRRRFLLRSIEASTTLTAEVKFGLISGILAFFTPKETFAQIIPFAFWKKPTTVVAGPTVQTTFAAGELWGFGGNWYGQFGDGTSYNKSSPVQVAGLWTMADGGSAHTIMLKPDNSLWAVGRNNHGQLGKNNTTTLYTPSQVGSGFNAIGPGRYTGLSVKTDGTLWAWGQNKNGILGLGDTVYRSSPVQVGGSWILAQSSAGGDSGATYHSLGIKSDGSLWAWGANVSGQLGTNNTTSYSSPVQVSSDRWIGLAVSGGNSLALKEDKTLWAWGSDDHGKLGVNTLYFERSSPVQIGGSWLQITCGRHHFAGIKTNYTLWTWGYGDNGELGQNSTTSRSSPTQIPGSWVSVGGGGDHTTAVRNDGSLWTWGFNSVGQLAQNNTTARSSPVQIGADYNWKYALQTAGNFSLAMRGNTSLAPINSTPGALWGWGLNADGFLGLGNTTYFSSPVQIASNYQFKQISSAYYSSALVRNDGTLWTAGSNTFGALGINSTVSQSTLQQVSGSWKMASGFRSAFAAIRDNDTLWTWGANNTGQLGDSSTTHKSSPVQITGGGTWKWVGCGQYHALAIKTDGTLWAWGQGNAGQLGQVTNIQYRSSPVQVGTESNWLKAIGGTSNSLALKTDGTLWAWGENSLGEHGVNDKVDRSSPIQIQGTWTDFSISGNHVLAKKSDGTLWAWGSNFYGVLGDNSTVHKSSPIQITNYKWGSFSAGESSSIAVREDGTLWTWGYNTYGNLGLNNTVNRSTPTQVGSNNDWFLVDAHGGGTIAVRGEATEASGISATYLNAGSTSGFSVTVPANCNALVAFGAGEDATLVHAFNNIKFDGTEFTNVANEASALTAPANTSSIWILKNPIAGTGNINWTSNTGGPENVQVFAITGVSGELYYRTGNASSPSASTTSFNWIFETEHQDSLIFTNLSLGDTVASDPTLTGTNFTWSTNGRVSFNSTATQIIHYRDGTGTPKSLPLNFAFPSAGRPTCTTIEFTTERRAWAYSLWTWGYGGSGDLAQITNVQHKSSPVQIGGDWIKVSSGGWTQHFGIKADGTLWAWGQGNYGELGIGPAGPVSSPVQIPGKWRDCAACSQSGFGIREDGTLWAWGKNAYGSLAQPNTTNRNSPVQIGTDKFWKKLAVTGGYSMGAIRNDGTLWMWGLAACIGDNSYIHRSSPVQVANGGTWKQVTLGAREALALKTDGTMWAWGSDQYGMLGQGTAFNAKYSPVQVGSQTWKSVRTNVLTAIAIRSDDTIWGWGRAFHGQLGGNDLNTRYEPTQISGVAKAVATGSDSSTFIKKDGTLWSMGYNTYGHLGNNSTTHRSSPVQTSSQSDWKQVSISAGATVRVLRDNLPDQTYSMWSSGRNSSGQLGINSTSDQSSPVQALGIAAWSESSTGWRHSMAIRSDGTLWIWGNNSKGQLGQNNTTSRSSPVQVGALNTWKYCSASGCDSSHAIKTDGTLWAWGYNKYGQLGLGNTANRSSPVQVGTLTNWKYVGANSYYCTHAVKTDGTLWGWGLSWSGAIGDGGGANRSSPVQIGGLTNWKNVSNGARFTLALKTDGTIWAWGRNDHGQLALNDTSDRASPVQIGTDTDWVQINAGIWNGVARKSDGTVWTWGAYWNGALGMGGGDRSNPTQVGALTDWADVNIFQQTVWAVKTNGELWGWGYNVQGRLGDGTTSSRYSPVLIDANKKWKSISRTGEVLPSALRKK